MPLTDEFRQRLATACFTVRQDDLWFRRRQKSESFEQFGLAGEGAETVERMNLAFTAIVSLAAQRAFALVADDPFRRDRPSQ